MYECECVYVLYMRVLVCVCICVCDTQCVSHTMHGYVCVWVCIRLCFPISITVDIAKIEYSYSSRPQGSKIMNVCRILERGEIGRLKLR